MHFPCGQSVQRIFASRRMTKVLFEVTYFTVTVSNCAPLTT
jgi:hypothetical protein